MGWNPKSLEELTPEERTRRQVDELLSAEANRRSMEPTWETIQAGWRLSNQHREYV